MMLLMVGKNRMSSQTYHFFPSNKQIVSFLRSTFKLGIQINLKCNLQEESHYDAK